MPRPRLLSDKELNTIRGKALVGKASVSEIQSVFQHIDMLERSLDEFDTKDAFGTEGWRRAFGHPDAD